MRRVNLLVYSLSLHRHSYIGFILVFASSIHNKLLEFASLPRSFWTADCGKRVLLSDLFEFVFGDFQVQRFKHSTNMSPKSKSKRLEKRTRLQQCDVSLIGVHFVSLSFVSLIDVHFVSLIGLLYIIVLT